MPDNRPVLLGQAIQDALDAAGKTKQWLADQLGKHSTQVGRLVNGTRKGVDVEVVRRIEQVLDLTPGHLLRAGGYVKDGITPREALASDPALEYDDRMAVLRLYDALAARAPMSTVGSSKAPTPPRRRRS